MYDDVIKFWFNENNSKVWFEKNDLFDNSIRNNFGALYESALNGNLNHWKDKPISCLALIIILDQFSRNLFRNNSKAYEQDQLSIDLSYIAIKEGYLENYSEDQKLFALLPLVHSENLETHLYANKMREEYLSDHSRHENIKKSWADHRKVIERFGRYPHRCKLKGLELTDAEEIFLQKPNSSW